MMRPVQHTALLIPDIFAMNSDQVTGRNGHSRSHSSVMGDQYGGAVGERQQKPLMGQTFCIVAKQLLHRQSASHFHLAQLLSLGLEHLGLINGCGRCAGSNRTGLTGWRQRCVSLLTTLLSALGAGSKQAEQGQGQPQPKKSFQ